ncbi:PilN domain-containing protein [Undibacterium fentianense]|uniref:PilN domain-containing protein n=1 Tax=Undibacterium fentianense TaxID=2828728 RepID=A0A941E0A7_9BURK|nr:PilN domain-containing protein [Undibacterium fentianense]MBR7800065.1 PilN domain-containing protein [Undibacterium fentianense]
MSQQINLLNLALLKKKDFFSALNLVIAASLSIGLVAVIFFVVQKQTAEAKRISTQSTAQLANLNEQLNSLRNAAIPKVKNPTLEKELNAIEAALLRRQQIAQMLQNSEFGNTDGYSAYLAALAKQRPENLWLTGFSIEGAGHDLVISGRTLEPELVPQYVTQLKREKIMQGKTFSTLQMERPLLPLPPSTNPNDVKKTQESAIYLEFQLHSTELKEKQDTSGGKVK